MRDEDFEVEEVPSYEPCGQGDHLFLWVEKRGMAPGVLRPHHRPAARHASGERRHRGLKDRHAVTRQWVSVPKECEPRRREASTATASACCKTGLHTNKLKPGHLRGNRFRILIRDANRAVNADAILDRIRTQGLPNFYGPQRFGRDGGTVDLGLQCLAGKAPRRIRPFLFRFALSAVQSLLFNDYLARRIRDGLFRTVLDGDVMAKWPVGGMFVAKDVAAEQARFDAQETVTAGPMFGKKTFPAEGAAAETRSGRAARQRAVTGVVRRVRQARPRHPPAQLVYLDDLAAAWEPDGLRLSFTLPAGSYATVLLARGDEDPDCGRRRGRGGWRRRRAVTVQSTPVARVGAPRESVPKVGG